MRIETNASEAGLGAVLYVGEVPRRFLLVALEEGDTLPWYPPGRVPERNAPASCSAFESKHIPVLELLIILIALRVWRDFAAHRGRAQVGVTGGVAYWTAKGDATAALGAAMKLRSPSRPMNRVARELAHDAALGHYHVEVGEHVRSLVNELPDELSRGRVPDALRGVRRDSAPPRGAGFWRTLGKLPGGASAVMRPAEKRAVLRTKEEVWGDGVREEAPVSPAEAGWRSRVALWSSEERLEQLDGGGGS